MDFTLPATNLGILRLINWIIVQNCQKYINYNGIIEPEKGYTKFQDINIS